MTATAAIELTVDQVWEHRLGCLLCKDRPRHRYVIVKVGDQVLVRELAEGSLARIGERYPITRALFGSLAKGGLRLAGTIVHGHLAPVDELDERVIDHDRVDVSRRPTRFVTPSTRGAF